MRLASRSRAAVAVLLAVSLLVLFALPVVASAEETDVTADATVAEEVTSTEAAPVDAAAAAEAAPVEVAPVESAPAVEEPSVAPVTTEATSTSTTSTVRPSLGASSYGSRAVAKSTASKSSQPRSAAATKLSVPDPDKKDDKNNEGGGCSGTASNFGLSAPEVTATTFNGAPATQFAWTVTYNADDGCEDEALSHITLIPCLDAVDGNYTPQESGNGSYKWDSENMVEVDDVLTLVFPGTVAATGTINTELKKSDEDPHSPSVAGPSCSTGGTCTSWSLSVDVTNTGVGTGTVSDNHSNTTGADATWVYTAAQMSNVDITALGTNGSTASNAGLSDISFSAHPGCSATYTVTFNKTDLQCQSWTLAVDVTNTGVGSGTVSDNHGNSTSTDTTWTYDGSQVGNVDLISNGTSGSSHSNSGASNVAFSAHPDCNAVYSVTFHKAPPTPDCSGDFDATNNGPNGDCTLPVVLDCNGDTDATNNGPNGDCTTPPVLDCNGDTNPNNNGPNGDCTIPPVPDCSGDFDSTNNGPNGDCTEPPTDVCPNIADAQSEVPEGMFINPVTGNCDEEEVLGEIIDKDPQPSKPEPKPRVDPQEVAPAVLPTNVQAGVLPFTGSTDLLPLVMIAGLLMSLGVGLTVKRPAKATK